MKKEMLLKIITLDGQVEEEATTRPAILHFFGQGNFLLSGKSQRILKREVCGNHDYNYKFLCSIQINLANLVPELIITLKRAVSEAIKYIQNNLKLAAIYEKGLYALPKQPRALFEILLKCTASKFTIVYNKNIPLL